MDVSNLKNFFRAGRKSVKSSGVDRQPPKVKSESTPSLQLQSAPVSPEASALSALKEEITFHVKRQDTTSDPNEITQFLADRLITENAQDFQKIFRGIVKNASAETVIKDLTKLIVETKNIDLFLSAARKFPPAQADSLILQTLTKSDEMKSVFARTLFTSGTKKQYEDTALFYLEKLPSGADLGFAEALSDVHQELFNKPASKKLHNIFKYAIFGIDKD